MLRFMWRRYDRRVMYYNTVNEKGDDLRDSWIKTANQNELILQLFLDNPNQSMTPDEINHMCKVLEKEWPITSIRRAISTLTDQGKLTKTDMLRKGQYGKKTHTWKIADKKTQENK